MTADSKELVRINPRSLLVAGWTFVGWLVIVLVLSIIMGATGSTGTSGRFHAEPLPDGVQELSPRAYLVHTTQPASICRDHEEHEEAIVESAPTVDPNLGTFVLCGLRQEWGVHRTPGHTFIQAIGRFWFDSWVWLVALGLFGACLVPSVAMGTLDVRETHRERSRRRASIEEQRQALAAAYASDEIDQPTFERKLEELLQRESR